MLKKILLIVLIFSIIIPSYSAVSVSDGSSFMTKSEVQSVVGNLSSRVSIIENSIDAKIDSLVSSYLSRNGIWNGTKQTVNKNTAQNSLDYFCATMGYGASGTFISNTTTRTYYNNYINQLNSENGLNQSNIQYLQNFGGGTYYRVINNFTKSGLLCVNFRAMYVTGSPYNGTRFRLPSDPIGQRNFWAFSWTYGANWVSSFTFYEYTKDTVVTDGSLISGSAVGKSLYAFSDYEVNSELAGYNQRTSAVKRDEYGTWYSFVSKDNSLVCVTSGTNNAIVSNFSSNSWVMGIYEQDGRSDFSKNAGVSAMYVISSAYIY